MTSSSAKAASSAGGSEAVAMMSRSLTASVRRRAEPASSTRSDAGCARSASTIPSPMSSALLSSTRAARRLAGAGRERLEDRLLELGPEAAHVAQLLGLGRRAQALERVDAELVVELAGALGPEAGQAREVDEARPGIRARSFSMAGIVPVSSSASIFSSSVRPMPGSSVTLPSRVMARDRARRLADRLGGVAVGEHAVDDGAVELVEVGQLVEERGDGGVGRIGHGRWPIRYAALHDRTRLARPAHLQRGREPRHRRGRGASRAGARRRPRASAS